MSAKLVWITPDAENIITYCARVSNPANQNNTETAPRLISYLLKNKHWSPFEMASMCVEIETTRAIAAQILRHRSFSFQEYSQRYAVANMQYEMPNFRTQDLKNRQSSHDNLDPHLKSDLRDRSQKLLDDAFGLYDEMIQAGVAKESARMVLPLCTKTKLYMCGTIRSWIHYLQIRGDAGTQKEHRDVAESVKKIFEEQLPNVSLAVFAN